MNKKVMFILQKISDGGAERVASVLCNELCKLNLDIILLVYFPTNNEYIINSSVKRLYLVQTETEYRKLSLLEKLRLLKKHMKDEKADYFVPFLYFVGVHVQLASIGLKGKVIQTVRNDPRTVPQSRKERWIRNIVYLFMWRGFVQNQRQLEYFPKFIRNKMTILPNPVAEEFLNSNRMNKDDKIIVSLGRLNEQKNFKMLIRVAKLLKDKNIEFRIMIYGDGELKEDLQDFIDENQVEDCCTLCGRTNSVPDVLLNANVFVMTSSYEGMPNALMEAMAMGLPCVSTNCPTGPAELIVDGENGFLVKIDDDVECTNKLILLLSDYDLAQKIGNRAKNSIEENYSASVITKRFLSEVLLI